MSSPSTTQDQEFLFADLLTIILTTSPIPSSPSPALVKGTLSSLPLCLFRSPLIITFDNYRVHNAEQCRLKKGLVTEGLANSYPKYVENVKGLFLHSTVEVEEADAFMSKATDSNTVFLRLKKRMGFASCIQIALKHVRSKYVLILQHDWLFTLPHPPMATLLSILEAEGVMGDVKYIGFISRMSLNYETSKGNSHHNYRHVINASRRSRKGRTLEKDLIACLHWFDRPHLASVETYRALFETGILKRGDFIEDTFGTQYLSNITKASSLSCAYNAWKRWSAWLYCPNNGATVGVRHASGRTDLLGERQQLRIQSYMAISGDKNIELITKECGSRLDNGSLLHTSNPGYHHKPN